MNLSSALTRSMNLVRHNKCRPGYGAAARSVSFVAFGVLLAVANSAMALPGNAMKFPHAKTPSFLWSEKIDMHVAGVPVEVRGFVADMTLEDAARLMARHRQHFQRVTTLPGSILLSGVYEGRHWVAQLDAGQHRTNGMISALPLEVNTAPQQTKDRVLTPWLTHNAGLVFTQESRVGDRLVTHSVHRPNQKLDTFLSSMAHHLQRSGWQRLDAHSWQHGEADASGNPPRIDIRPVAAQSNAFVFISQSD